MKLLFSLKEREALLQKAMQRLEQSEELETPPSQSKKQNIRRKVVLPASSSFATMPNMKLADK